jgi:short-subunit dehydrogenase
MTYSWKNKTAVITGASSGVGASFAKFLAQAGLHVVLTARRAERLKDLQAEIIAQGGKASYFSADISIEDERESLFKKINAVVGDVDILINNAGFGWYGYYSDMPWELAEQMMAVNTMGVLHLTNQFLPGMLVRGKGHIINIGSIAGGLPNQGIAVYSASKAFIDAFTTSLYRELQGSNVQASVMRLGPVKTEFYERSRELKNGGSIPVERFAISTDQVNTALWRLINHPRRVVYVPRWMAVSRYIENIFGGALDRIGPILLEKRDKHKNQGSQPERINR